MTEPNVAIPFYDELGLFKRAVRSVPDHLHIHAFDGRWETFPGEHDVTPGAKAWCADRENVTYHAPPPERRPWGVEMESDDPTTRYDQTAEARFMNYETLPEDEWVLKLDADETIAEYDGSVFEALDERRRYKPVVGTAQGERLFTDRIYVPKYWTFWLDDCYFPRGLHSRERPVEHLAWIQRETDHNQLGQGGVVEAIRIVNHGEERSAGYQERRAEHLEAMGRDKRAREYRKMLVDGEWHRPGYYGGGA